MSVKKIVLKPRFEAAYLKHSRHDQDLIDRALEQFGGYLVSGHAPSGLGLKHLAAGTYEFRAGLYLRILYIHAKNEVFICFLGSHDEVRKFLKNQ